MSFLSELGFSNEALGFEELVRIILKPGALFGALEQSVVLTFFMHLFSSCGKRSCFDWDCWVSISRSGLERNYAWMSPNFVWILLEKQRAAPTQLRFTILFFSRVIVK